MTALMLDHLAVAGETLDEATAHVEDTLGVSLSPGGVHVEMGTHNRLLSLGPGLYLEAIAINPDALHPARPRWFDLDRFAGAPRLTNWIARTDDLAGLLAMAPDGMGVPIGLNRGDFSWSMAVPGNGCLPFDGAAPALIEWDTALHPADRLSDAGCRLSMLEVAHPQMPRLLREFPALQTLSLVEFLTAPSPSLRATIETPSGTRVLA
jgi:hypothetical protein